MNGLLHLEDPSACVVLFLCVPNLEYPAVNP
jgi:hypothetical protein